MQKLILGFFCFLILVAPVSSQEQRITDRNPIGWFTFLGTFQLNKKYSLHTEYQNRRVDDIQNIQQNLIRIGLNYQLNTQVFLHTGYGYINTHPYGDFPIAAAGVPFPEHRIYEQVILKNPVGKSELTHRFRLEQRWIGKITAQSQEKVAEWIYLNRIRYLFRWNFPIHKKLIEDNCMYAGIYDEVFIGFGNNVVNQFFDQNRIGLLLGYKINKHLKLEAGYLNQTLVQGSRVNGNSVVQANNGFQFSLLVNADLYKQSQ